QGQARSPGRGRRAPAPREQRQAGGRRRDGEQQARHEGGESAREDHAQRHAVAQDGDERGHGQAAGAEQHHGRAQGPGPLPLACARHHGQHSDMSDLAKLRWPEVEVLLRRGCAAILPVGATEAHGPHLPLDTDVTIALGMARRAAAALQLKGRACVVLPPLAYAVTDFAAPFAGTLSLPAATATALVRDVLLAAAARGFRPVALANAHLEPAHIETLRAAVAAATAAAGGGTPIVFPDVTRRRLAERL